MVSWCGEGRVTRPCRLQRFDEDSEIFDGPIRRAQHLFPFDDSAKADEEIGPGAILRSRLEIRRAVANHDEYARAALRLDVSRSCRLAPRLGCELARVETNVSPLARWRCLAAPLAQLLAATREEDRVCEDALLRHAKHVRHRIDHHPESPRHEVDELAAIVQRVHELGNARRETRRMRAEERSDVGRRRSQKIQACREGILERHAACHRGGCEGCDCTQGSRIDTTT